MRASSPLPQQAVLPTLLTRLRKGAFLATSGTSYPCLLPLLASLPLQTLLAPAAMDGRAAGAPPFCAALLETLWTTISKPGGSGGVDAVGGDRGGSSGWLADVVSAHVECATFLLLKLPPQTPSPEGGGVAVPLVLGDEEGGGGAGTSAGGKGAEDAALATASSASAAGAAGGGGSGGDTGLEPAVAVSVSAATDNVVRAVRSLAVDEEEEDAVVAAAAAVAAGEGLGGRIQRAARRSPIVREAFSRALGQLHLGAEKGAGAMGSASGAAAVWGALLRELKGALDQRWVLAVCWGRAPGMSDWVFCAPMWLACVVGPPKRRGWEELTASAKNSSFTSYAWS